MKTRILAPPWHLLVLLLFLLPALLPLLSSVALPCTHDNDLHYYRITAIDAAWRQGWIFSRWVPNLALGYGYPFFNYREPLPYIVGALLYQTGLALPLVLGLLYVASFLAAAWGAYVFARDLFGERAAWIAALAYGLGPYLLLDALRRGNMPESLALALLPWLLVTFRRVIVGRGRTAGGGRGPFVASVALLAALFLSHNISSLLFAPLLGGYVIVLAWVYRARKAWPWAFAAALLAVILTSWFWFPALTEQSAVQLHLSRTTRNNDFRYNFASWREMLFTPPTPYDPGFLNPPMRVPLGVVQTALAVAGVVIGWQWVRDRSASFGRKDTEVVADADDRESTDALADSGLRRREVRASIVFFALAAVAYLWMSTPASLPRWEAFPMLAFVQFPWRLVGRALLPVSLLAAASFSLTPASRLLSTAYRLLFYVALTLLALFSWPDTYPPKGYCAMASYPTMANLYAYEQQGWLGVDPEGSYFPVWVERHPVDTTLADAFARGAEPERLDASAFPEGVRVVMAEYRPLQATITLETPTAFQARWLGFYFPGWQVTLDGAPVRVKPEPRTGLLTFAVPEGIHEIDVRFTATPTHGWLAVISVAGLLLFGLAAWWIKRPAEEIADASEPRLRWRRSETDEDAPAENHILWVLDVLALLLLALKILVVDHTAAPLHYARLAAGELPEVTQSLMQPFTGGLTLLGYSVQQPRESFSRAVASSAVAESARLADQPRFPGDGEIQVDLLWQARDIPPAEYHAVVLLIGADGQRWSPAGGLRPRGYEPAPPTTMWLPGNYAYDPHIVEMLPGTPPGTYSIVVSLFDKRTLTPASVLGASGNPLGPELTLGTVRVTPPQTRPDLRTLQVPTERALQRCGALGIWTMAVDRPSAAPGELVGLRWVWQAVETPSAAVEAELLLLDSIGAVMGTWQLPLSTDWWPTDRWSAGQRWVGRPLIRVPGSVESGAYRLLVFLPGCDGVLAEAPLEIQAPERVWRAPEGLVRVDTVFSDVEYESGAVRLIGYRLDPETPVPGETLTVRLAWQAVEEMAVSYRVFVHFVGESLSLEDEATDAVARVLAQSDGEPVDWTRPTTGWAVGEVIVEEREIAVPATLPSGESMLFVGLYRPDGVRLLTADGEDAFVLWTGFLSD